ncbi:MAG: hypothetical protein LBK82_06755 [Planctomycetaceae bacterium]|jgi:uncharacterized protein (DUF3084 family)|nr:hypothetical protein [Planctomycetaceae bacterium]
MSNNNLANISTFENLQNQANASFGNSQMSVFQENVVVNNSFADAQKLYKDYEKSRKERAESRQKVRDAQDYANRLDSISNDIRTRLISVIEKDIKAIDDKLKGSPDDSTMLLKEKQALEALDEKANQLTKSTWY